MDIAGVSMAMADISLQSQVSTEILSKSMDTNEALGAGLVEMMDSAAMELSVNPNIGANINLHV